MAMTYRYTNILMNSLFREEKTKTKNKRMVKIDFFHFHFWTYTKKIHTCIFLAHAHSSQSTWFTHSEGPKGSLNDFLFFKIF